MRFRLKVLQEDLVVDTLLKIVDVSLTEGAVLPTGHYIRLDDEVNLPIYLEMILRCCVVLAILAKLLFFDPFKQLPSVPVPVVNAHVMSASSCHDDALLLPLVAGGYMAGLAPGYPLARGLSQPQLSQKAHVPSWSGVKWCDLTGGRSFKPDAYVICENVKII